MNIAFRRALVACMAIVSMTVGNVSAQTRNPADFAEGKVINTNNHYQKNGNHVLGLAFDTTACGLNYVGAKKMITSRYNAVAINTFGTGFPATLSISGLPNSCYAVVRAFIWWDVSYFAGSSDTPLLVLTNPFGAIDTIAATDIGSDASKCWGEVGTRTFRADVTNYITGNGAYVLDSIIGSNSREVDGASLIIIYRDLNAPYTGSISIWDGCISIGGGTVDQVINIDTVCAAATNARAFYMAADLQDNVATTHQATLNSIVGNYTQDFWNFDDTATTVSVGQATSDFGISISSDCYNFILAGLYYQTTTCTVCIPTGFSFAAHQTPIPCGSVSGATASVTTGGGIGPFSFVWSPSGGTDATATGLSAGVYHCIITDLGGLCTAIATFDIVQQDVINPHTFHVPITCHDSANGLAYVNPTGGVGAYMYLWTPSGGTSATASSFSAGTYTISIVDGNGCFIIDTVSFTDPAPIVVVPSTLDVPCNGGTTGAATATVSGGNGPYNYSWSPSVGLGNSALSITAGTYFVTITDNTGCTATQAFTLTQPPPITIAISNDTTVCPGDAVNLFAIASGGSVPYHYVWSNGVMNSTQTVHPTVTTVYSNIVTDANGCASQTYFDTVTVLPAPVITFSPQNPTICIGDAVTITANGTSNYLWSTGSTNASISVSPTATTVYSITGVNAIGCPSITYHDTVTVLPKPVVTIVPDTATICYGNSITLVANGTGTFVWSNGSTASSITVSPTATTSYMVTITAGGCVGIPDTATVTVVGNGSSVSFIATPDSGFEPLVVHFTPSVTSGFNYRWNFGDSTYSIDTFPTHTYMHGTYTVTLIVTNAFGCVDSFTLRYVIVETNSYFTLPNVFTPNGDGKNDLFVPDMKNIASINARIFNRWGELVYKWTDIAGGWNGLNANGQPEPDGTYYYLIDAKGKDGIEYNNNKGFVTLIR